MSLTSKEIEQPLGQGRRPSTSGPRPPVGRVVASGIAVIAVVAAAGAIALRGSPFREPVPEVVTTPEVATAAPAPEAAKPPLAPAKPSDGPKIIKVEPKDGEAPGAIVVRDPSAIGQDLRVAHLPDRALIEDSPAGPLPVRAADGRRPMDVYARPWSGARGARVAIVIGGFAISQTGTQAALETLPPEVTIAFSPQGNSIGRWMQTARQKGHEILMQVPLEPFDYPNVDPGRNTLTVDAGEDETLKNLHWALSRTTNYTGVMNFMGARFSADDHAMQTMLADLGRRGLLYLDDGSTARSAAPEVALRNGVAFAAGDTIIDGTR